MAALNPDELKDITTELDNINSSINIGNALNEINTNYAILSNRFRGIKACDESLDKIEDINNKIYDIEAKTGRAITEIMNIIESNQNGN